MSENVTARLAAFVEQAAWENMPLSVRDKARMLVMDFMGVAVRGSQEPSPRIALEVARQEGGNPLATVIGQEQMTSVAKAALLNGISGHALDYDDVSQIMYGHPTVAVLPAALAVAEFCGAGGAKLLEAYIIGVEVACKLAHVMNPSHYKLGWHSTSTLGVMGAAAAAAKIMGLDKEKIRYAFALAASQASGLQQNFGTMTKPFHAGMAAYHGVVSAQLADKGFTGDQNILEAPLGFFNLYTAGALLETGPIMNGLGNPFEIEEPGLIIKKHPSCAFSHPPADAALEIVQRPGFAAGQVKKVTGFIHGLADQILIHQRPRTGLEAKFSLEAVLALALSDGVLTLQAFSDESLARDEVQSLIKKTQRVVENKTGAVAKDFGPATVSVEFTDGRQETAMVEKAKGTPQNPMSEAELRAKYNDCCSLLMPEAVRQKSIALLDRLAELPDLNELLACYRSAA